MKKRIVAIFTIITAFSFVLNGCGKGNDDKSESEKSSSDNEVDESNELISEDEESFVVYLGTVETEDNSPINYTCYIRENGTAELYQEYLYSDNYSSTYHYIGTYEETDKGYNIIYSEDESYTCFEVSLEGDVITNVAEKYDSVDYSEIVGKYTGETEEFGEVTITIDADGTGTFKTSEETYEATVIFINDRWDLMVYDDLTGGYLVDWYIDFDEDSFTYEQYAVALYKEYEGVYEADGELGKITISVDECGNATCTLKYDGAKREFFGSIIVDNYDDSESEPEIGFFLNADDKYDLSITLEKTEDGTYSYIGSITINFAYM